MFWINAGLGLLLTIAFALAGPLLARFYGDPRIAGVTVAMSATIFLTSLSVQHLALLKRAMRFSVVSRNDIVARTVSVVVSIVLGWAAWGYWALVGGSGGAAAGDGRRGVERVSMGPGRAASAPGHGTDGAVRRADLRAVPGRLLAPGTWTTFSSDGILARRPWGFYKKAYDLFVLPLNQLSAPLTNVAVSAMSRLRHDPEQRARHFLRALSTLAFVGMGLGAALTLVGRDVILLLLGPGWEESGRIFTLFGPGIGIMLLYCTNGWIHLSIGRADRWFMGTLVELAVTTGLFLLRASLGASRRRRGVGRVLLASRDPRAVVCRPPGPASGSARHRRGVEVRRGFRAGGRRHSRAPG